MNQKNPEQMTPAELQEFLEQQRPKGRGAKAKMPTYDVWVDMMRKCYDPTYPEYLNHETRPRGH